MGLIFVVVRRFRIFGIRRVDDGGTPGSGFFNLGQVDGVSYSADFTVPILGWKETSSNVITPLENVRPIRYSTDTVQSLTHNTITILDFEDRAFDDESLVTTGASWKYTVKSDLYFQAHGLHFCKLWGVRPVCFYCIDLSAGGIYSC